jgi:DNA-binding XRE family transcriptional regulator
MWIMQIKITNKIEEKVVEYQKRTGATKTWIAEQLGMSKQRMYSLFKADNMMLDVALKFAAFFKCKVEELFDYDVINSDDKK